MSEPAPVTYVSTEDLLVVGERLFGGKLPVRDWGLLEAALVIVAITSGELEGVPAIAERLAGWVVRR